jgi:hypothetical protein
MPVRQRGMASGVEQNSLVPHLHRQPSRKKTQHTPAGLPDNFLNRFPSL